MLSNTKKTDFDSFAPSYDDHRTGTGPYLPVLLSHARAIGAREVLELGAGTGNTAAALLNGHQCHLTGLEMSWGMLERARAKGVSARWARGDARALPFNTQRFDFVFSVLVLHHIADIDSVFREAFRVLRPGGRLLIVTASHEFIRAHPMNAYFPTFATIDCARFQPEETIVGAMKDAGFVGIEAKTARDAERPIDEAYVERVAGKFISTYRLMEESTFEAGMKKLRQMISNSGGCAGTITWECLVIAADKP